MLFLNEDEIFVEHDFQNEMFCDLWDHFEHGEFYCEPIDYLWNSLYDQWQCSKCSQGLHRIYDSRNTLDAWIK